MIPIDLPGGGPSFVDLGVGGTFALLLIDRFLAYIRSRNGNAITVNPPKGLRVRPEDFSVEFDELMRLVQEIHEEVTDAPPLRPVRDAQ